MYTKFHAIPSRETEVTRGWDTQTDKDFYYIDNVNSHNSMQNTLIHMIQFQTLKKYWLVPKLAYFFCSAGSAKIGEKVLYSLHYLIIVYTRLIFQGWFSTAHALIRTVHDYLFLSNMKIREKVQIGEICNFSWITCTFNACIQIPKVDSSWNIFKW